MNKNFVESKKGFSLMEVTIALVIVGIFAALSAPIITKKLIKPVSKTPHGRYECYKKGSALYQRLTIENKQGSETNVSGTGCFFTPKKNAAYYMIQAVGGGGGGSSATNGQNGTAGSFESMFVPTLTAALKMTIGGGGAAGNPNGAKGGDTSVGYNNSQGAYTNLLTAIGGAGGLGSGGGGVNLIKGTNPDGSVDLETYTGRTKCRYVKSTAKYRGGTEIMENTSGCGTLCDADGSEGGINDCRVEAYYSTETLISYIIWNSYFGNSVDTYIPDDLYHTGIVKEGDYYVYTYSHPEDYYEFRKSYAKFFPVAPLVSSNYGTTCPPVNYYPVFPNHSRSGLPLGATYNAARGDYEITNCNRDYHVNALIPTATPGRYMTGLYGDIVSIPGAEAEPPAETVSQSPYDDYMQTAGYTTTTTGYGAGGIGKKNGTPTAGKSGAVVIIW